MGEIVKAGAWFVSGVPFGTVQTTVPDAPLITALLPATLVPKVRMSFAVEIVVKLCGAAAQTVFAALVARKVK